MEGSKMRDLTVHELDAQLAEELPERELMQATAVAIGALAANFAHVEQANVVDNSTVGGSVSQSNASGIGQSASATNSGDVTALAYD
jgi:orotate phosphoribosyltransferase-like protein